jgi:hypothetical protein
LEKIVDFLRQHGVILAHGLTNEEVSQVESTFAFRFPPDLRQLLQYALPISPHFPNWRDDSGSSLRGRLDWPVDGICFDIVNNDFWWDDWGPKPLDTPTALDVARREIAQAPVLIPIYSHGYIPGEPHLAGNPVFSAHQTDIIYYGSNLENYFINEFSPHEEQHLPEYAEVRKIRFWSQLVETWGNSL